MHGQDDHHCIYNPFSIPPSIIGGGFDRHNCHNVMLYCVYVLISNIHII